MKVFLSWLPVSFGFVGGSIAVAVAAFMRLFVISGDPFDPNREVSVSLLWAGCWCFVGVALFARFIEFPPPKWTTKRWQSNPQLRLRSARRVTF